MTVRPKYRLTFTGASFRLNEMVKVARAAKEMGITDFKKVEKSGIVFGSMKSTSSERVFIEIRHRLEKLIPEQLDILVNGDLDSQKHIAFLAICKNYSIIRDFTIEVLRDKMLVYNNVLNDSDFKSFIDRKLNLHPELEEFSESTVIRAKRMMYQMFEQAGLINNITDKVIKHQILHNDVIRSVVKDDPNWLKIYLVSDADINLMKNYHGRH